MKVLVIGSGGREHALIWKLQQSSAVDRIFCAPGNAGTALVAENVAVAPNDFAALIRFAKDNAIGLTVVGPDDPLAAGIVDVFEAERLRIFGPNKSAARLESSKIFAKELMREQRIPTAAAQTFSDSRDAQRYAAQLQFPIVIKADGLALGKGVIIAQHSDEAANAINEMMDAGKFGEAGRRVVIEEFLRGSECSLHALVDGRSYRILATARDHKRAFDDDMGPNTGGMGAISPAENWNEPLAGAIRRQDHSAASPRPNGQEHFVSRIAFSGLIVTEKGAQVLEFNCRFGDPETQAILPRLKSDLLELLVATIDGTLDKMKIEWDERTCVTVVMASGGYPEKYATGKKITGLEQVAKLNDIHVFHAGTKMTNGDIVTSGGRVLAVSALGKTQDEARRRAYDAVSQIHFENCHYRRDIAVREERDKLTSR